MVPRQGPYGYDIKDDHGYPGKGPWAIEVLRQGPYNYGIGSESGDTLKGELSLDRDVPSSFPPTEQRKRKEERSIK